MSEPTVPAEAPTDLAELFARDPLSLEKKDIAAIVEALRQRRGQYALGAQKAGNMKQPSAKAKAAAELGSKLGIKLDLSSIMGKKP